MSQLHAERVRPRIILGAVVATTALGLWALHHAARSMQTWQGHGSQFATVYAVSFALLGWQVIAYSMDRPYTVTDRQARQLDELRITVPVPTYNEDPQLLRNTLRSLLEQTRLPQIVYVVDDGSKVDYGDVRNWFLKEARKADVLALWHRTENQGKRHAQAHAIRATKDETDVYVTADSDAVWSPNALEEILKPLADPKVQSVAGVVIATNNRANLLARITDLIFVTGQLVDRSGQSVMKNVLVNSGPLAAYRAKNVADNLELYLNEKFMGRTVSFSDDSMLTLFSKVQGHTVQQSSAFVFSTMPETFDHHIRQFKRWMRGSTIRSIWRIKYLPVTGLGFWIQVSRWFQMAVATVVLGTVLVAKPLEGHPPPLEILLVPVIIGYAQSLRYLSFRRNDEPFRSQLLTYALSPVAQMWAFFVMRPVRWYCMATCMKIEWGTRKKVEITSTGTEDTEEVSLAELWLNSTADTVTTPLHQ